MKIINICNLARSFILFLILACSAKAGFVYNLGPSSSVPVIPNDGANDTPGIQAALTQANGKKTVRIKIPPGTYDLWPEAGALSCLNLFSARDVIIDATGAVFVVHGIASAWNIENCQMVLFKGGTVRYDPLPFLHGTVLSQDAAASTTTLTVDSLTSPLSESYRIKSLYTYDPALGGVTANGFEWYTDDSIGTLMTRISGNQYSIPTILKNSKVGANYVLRLYNYEAQAFNVLNCDDAIVEDLKIETAPGMGLVCMGSYNLEIRRVIIGTPTQTAWISTCADGIHLSCNRGFLRVTDCAVYKSGDDGIAVPSLSLIVRKLDSTRVGVEHERQTGWVGVPKVKQGDHLVLTDPNDPYVYLSRQDILSTSLGGARRQQVANWGFSGTWPAEGYYTGIIEEWNPSVVISGCTIKQNRARGIIVQVQNPIVRNNTVIGSSGPGILARSDRGKWFEGTIINSLEVSGNTVEGCNYSLAKADAAITIDIVLAGNVPTSRMVHTTATITSNTIKSTDNGICIRNTKGAQVTLNQFVGVSTPLVVYGTPTLTTDSAIVYK